MPQGQNSGWVITSMCALMDCKVTQANGALWRTLALRGKYVHELVTSDSEHS